MDIDIKKIKSEISELPQAKRERFKQEYNLLEKEIEVFVQNKELSHYFEKAMSELRNWVKEAEIKTKVERDEFLRLAKLCSNYMLTDLQGLLKQSSVKNKDFKITPENFAEFISLIYQGKISSKLAKTLLQEMFSTGADPSHIIKKKGLVQITDAVQVEKIVEQVISKNSKTVADFKKGKENALQFLIGQVMAQSKGKANPEIVNKILKKKLSG